VALNDTLLNIGVTAMQNAATHLSLHSAQPSTAGSNETTAGRVAASWGAAANGDFSTLTNKSFTGGAAGGAVTHVGFWSASTGGTFYGWLALTGDQTFNSAGEYTITSLSVPGSAA
jgi:hypothetical protein